MDGCRQFPVYHLWPDVVRFQKSDTGMKPGAKGLADLWNDLDGLVDRDSTHITDSFARTLQPYLAQAIPARFP